MPLEAPCQDIPEFPIQKSRMAHEDVSEWLKVWLLITRERDDKRSCVVHNLPQNTTVDIFSTFLFIRTNMMILHK